MASVLEAVVTRTFAVAEHLEEKATAVDLVTGTD